MAPRVRGTRPSTRRRGRCAGVLCRQSSLVIDPGIVLRVRMTVISRQAAVSNRSSSDGGGLGERCAQLAQRTGFDLPGALGGQPKPGADLAERPCVLAEPVVGPDHHALTLVELFGQVVHVTDLKGVE